MQIYFLEIAHNVGTAYLKVSINFIIKKAEFEVSKYVVDTIKFPTLKTASK